MRESKSPPPEAPSGDSADAPLGGARETARLEAFSDAVFAFAITLLAVDLHVPHPKGEPSSRWLVDALRGDWPRYLTFLASFVTVFIMWSHHHAVFRLVRRSDPRLLFANGFLLMMTTTVAFPTAIVAEYLHTPAASAAVMLYVGQQCLLAIAFHVLLRLATRPGTLSPDAPRARVRALKRIYAVGPPLYVVLIALAYVTPQLAIAISIALWIFWALITEPRLVAGDIARR
jgi:uncharacterized membrane protein